MPDLQANSDLELIGRMKQADPNLSETELQTSLSIAREVYRDVRRADGQSLMEHCLHVGDILAELKVDSMTVCAGILHEVWMYSRDTASMREKTGQELYELIKQIASLNLLNFMGGEEEQANNLHKMFIAMARDVRVILIKLADRLQNMRTLSDRGEEDWEDSRRIARETLEIFAPLAHRLGMSQIKSELEDLSFAYLFPEAYARVKKKAEEGQEGREIAVRKAIDSLKEVFGKNGLKVHITGRTKHLYSIYLKTQRQDKAIEELDDLAAVRVVVDNVEQCYRALGILHNIWTPIPETFDDYIATPKSNGYQSLHTAVVGPEGERVEVQIRTWEMHMKSEYGVAAHWSYKMESRGKQATDDSFGWIQRFVGWDKDIVDPHEYLQTVKLDLFEDEVFVFTPKGRVVTLPIGATPVDFAFRIHTQVGFTCQGALVNGKMSPLDHELHNGDTVEIITQKNKTPSADWLNFVKSSQARSRIKSWFKKANREENVAQGQAMFDRELERAGIRRSSAFKQISMEDVAARNKFKTAEDMFAAIGCGDQSAVGVVAQIKSVYKNLFAEAADKGAKTSRDSAVRHRKAPDVRVGGLKDVVVNFSKCCYPVPKEEIIAFVSKGRGLALHRRDCRNILPFLDSGVRIVDVEWGETEGVQYVVGLSIYSHDRKNLLVDLAARISEEKLNVVEISARARKNGTAKTVLKVEVQSSRELFSLMRKISMMEDVISIQRGEG